MEPAIIMNAFVHKPSQSEQTQLRRNTGFPEPLSKDRNTTLPHPDADKSEGATIEAQEVIVLNHTRPRRSILPFQHRFKGNSKGGILDGLYDNIQYADGSNHDRSSKELEQKVEGRKNISDAPPGYRSEQGHKEERTKGAEKQSLG